MINTVAIPNCELIINMHLFYQLDYVQLLFILVLDILLPCRELMVHIHYWTVQLYFITFIDAFVHVIKVNYFLL